MTKGLSVPSGLVAFESRRLSLNISSRTLPGAGALAFGLLTAAWMLQPHRSAAPVVGENIAAAPKSIEAPPAPGQTASVAHPYGRLLLDLRSHARVTAAAQPPAAVHSAAAVQSPASQMEAKLEAAAEPEFPLPPTKPEDMQTNLAPPPSPVDDEAPLPPRRPTELGQVANPAPPSAPAPAPVPSRRTARQSRQAAVAAAPVDNRSFLEKLFGQQQGAAPQPAGRSLAYAAPESGIQSGLTSIARSATSATSLRYDRYTAIYDISAHTVYLPNGTRLEAHSGLGGRLDDPRYVHEKMHGATPPNVYELTPREQLFHGVQALRLNPVGGGTVYGRAGLLAHTYMLGPNGDSNGCVSFRNYQAFLQAYQSGEIRRLAVVARLD